VTVRRRPRKVVDELQSDGGNPLTVAPNGGSKVRRAVDAADAAQIARYAIAHSKSVDLGLMQVNSRILAALGYTVEEMFDACKNIRVVVHLASDFIDDLPDSLLPPLEFALHRDHHVVPRQVLIRNQVVLAGRQPRLALGVQILELKRVRLGVRGRGREGIGQSHT
jgi:hypothetical protein